MKSKKVLTSQVVPGMVVADDIYTFNNQLVIAKNTTLTNRSITRLKFYSINTLKILVEEEGKPVKKPVSEEENYSEVIKSSPEFKEFNSHFEQSLDSFKDTLKNFEESDHTNLDINSLSSEVSEIISKSRNNAHIFYMLHCMRDYTDLTYAHSLNVSIMCNVCGKWLKMSQEDIEVLTLAGLLHDIGKLLVPSSILDKPSSLTEKEFAVIKMHPMNGYELIKKLPLDRRIQQAVLMHHERCDGSGYPSGMKGKRIDNFAKIVAICDTYDAMTSARVYRAPICPFEAISIFEAEGLQKFDPHFLLTFLEGVVQTYIHNQVRLSNGMIGEVIMLNRTSLPNPIVKCGDKYVNLFHEKDISIVEVIQ